MAKAEHARLSGPDVSKLRDLLNRIQITKGSLEQAIVEKKEAQLIQSLSEGRELNLNPVLLQQGERALQQIIERKNKRLMAKNGMSTPAMQAIAMSSASSNMASNVQSDQQDVASLAAPAAKMSLIQEVIRSLSSCVFLYGFTPLFIYFLHVSCCYTHARPSQENTAALRFALSFASLSVQEKRVAQVVAQHVQARDLESAVSEQVTLLRLWSLLGRLFFDAFCRPLCVRPSFNAWEPNLSWQIFPCFGLTTAASQYWDGALNRVRRRSWSWNKVSLRFECSTTCSASWATKSRCILKCKPRATSRRRTCTSS